MSYGSYSVSEYKEIKTHTDLPPNIVREIGACCLKAFGDHMDEQDIINHTTGDLVVTVHDAHQDDRVVAFGAADLLSPYEKFEDERLSREIGCYFAAAAIAGDQQGRGLYHILNERRMQLAIQNNSPMIYTQTQNPRVQEGITNSIRRLEPTTGVGIGSISRIVRSGIYGGMLTHTQPMAKNLSYDDINYARGDAAIITWSLDKN